MKKPTTKQIESQWKKYQPKIQVQHILVKTEDEAKQNISDYQKDPTEKNFESLAKKNSIDTGTKNKGGKLAAFDNTDTSLDSTFKSAAFKLKKAGDITTTPVKTQYGYHVIRVISIAKKRYDEGTQEGSWKADLHLMAKWFNRYERYYYQGT